jgi:predicted metal-dependent hydrolase
MRAALQYTLDLFDAVLAPAGKTQDAIENVATPWHVEPYVPGLPLQDALAATRYVHPAANREVHLPGAVVAYLFARARRRTIGFVVGPEGLSVRAPRWTPLREVEAALQEKGRWILRKLDETRQRKAQQESDRIVWSDGVVFPFLGQQLKVVLSPGRGSTERDTDGNLNMALPTHATPVQIRDAVQAWLMRRAQTLFTERLHYFAPQLGVQWNKLRLSNAGTRWGSARSDGSIRLNWRLVHFRPEVIDYVVAHELSHLRVMDHSPRFWDTVRSVVPDYPDLQAQLKQAPVPKW